MDYNAAGNTLAEFMRDDPRLRDLMIRKAVAGAKFWTANSIVDTGHNSRSVGVLIDRNDLGHQRAVIYAFGHYARFREHGTRYNEPERVLHKSVGVIKEAR